MKIRRHSGAAEPVPAVIWIRGGPPITMEAAPSTSPPTGWAGRSTQSSWRRSRRSRCTTRAHDTALYWLGQRDLSGRELEKKLAAGETPPEVAAAVVERLRQVGLLDDAAYARRAARSLAQYKQYPRRRVEQELLRRGIDRALTEPAAGGGGGNRFRRFSTSTCNCAEKIL